ncbi:RDD family protein [Luteimicrobium sp. NPDC057192]|uniref:RDD family protein n=1 Tax=Luteimicrobium sp. NPDC057192 TaxID=3346042 RepID=UPI003640DA2E
MSPVTLCPRCGAAVAPGVAQCPSCGAAVAGAIPSPNTTEPMLLPGARPAPGHPGAAVRQVSVPTALTAHTLPGFPVPGPAAPDPANPVGAPLGRRVLAWLIDAIIVGIPSWIAVAVMLPGILDKSADAASGTTAFTPSDLFPLQALVWGLMLVAGLVVVGIEGATGRTVGKLALGLRTQDVATGLPIGVARGIVRGLVFGAFMLVCWVGELLVLLSPVFDSSPRRQGWQDKAARAVVVRVEAVAPAARPLASAAAAPAPPAPTPPAAAPAAAAPYAGVPPFTPAPYGTAPQAPAPSATSTTSGGWAPPAAPAPGAAAPAAPAATGMVTGVPGAGAPAAPQTPAPQSPQAAWTGGPAAPAAAAGPGFDLGLPDGSTVRVTGPTLLGRDPAVPPSQTGPAPQLVPVPDPGRSVSKTHAELGVDAHGLWLVDRGSTNGTTVEVPGATPVKATPGQQVRVPAGATVRLGDAAVLVRGDGPDVPDESTVISSRRPPSGGGSW